MIEWSITDLLHGRSHHAGMYFCSVQLIYHYKWRLELLSWGSETGLNFKFGGLANPEMSGGDKAPSSYHLPSMNASSN